MQITFQLTLGEYQDAVAYHYKKGKRPVFVALFLGMATFMLLVGTDFSNNHEVINNILVTFFAISFYILFTRMITAYQAKRFYTKSPILSSEVTMRISGKGIQHDKKSNNEIIPWNYFTQWRESEKYYLIYTKPYQFSVIPKRVLSEKQENELRGYLNKYIGEAK